MKTFELFLFVIVMQSVSILAAPTSSSSTDADYVKQEASVAVIQEQKDEGMKIHHHHHHHKPTTAALTESRLRQRAIIIPSKDTFQLLRTLRKVQGPDGLSPVCKVCQNSFVDAITYDFFCLPDSEGVDGDTCDTLTILGTTTSRKLSLSCKLLYSRSPTLCK